MFALQKHKLDMEGIKLAPKNVYRSNLNIYRLKQKVIFKIFNIEDLTCGSEPLNRRGYL